MATENSGTFDYDDADSLTSINGQAQTYDDANQLLTSGTRTFGYDNQGNRTSQTTSSVTTNLGFDQSNRLTSFGTNASYEYDGGGLRTSKTVSSTTSNFVYDTAQGLPLVIDDGTNAYIYGPGGTGQDHGNERQDLSTRTKPSAVVTTRTETRLFTTDSTPRRTASVSGSNSPAFATSNGSSKVTDKRSIERDTELTGSASASCM